MRTLKILLGLGCVVAVAGIAFIAWTVVGRDPMRFAKGPRVTLAAYNGPSLTGAPPELAHADLVTRGEYLTRAADCQACHTKDGGVPFAGGRVFKLPFGTLFSPNITPDQATGIGGWSDAEFLRAVHKGVGRGGKPLYPAFPYAAYTLLTDDDVLAIKAYLFSLKPIHAVVPENTLVFPFNQRLLMTVWSAMFNADTRFEPVADRAPAWNRGAYLVEAAGHCGECHSPRNLFQAIDNRKKFAGAVADGWRAYNISSDKPTGIGSWSEAQLASYLTNGHAAGRGSPAGPMREAVDMSLAHLTPSDVQAVVAYLRTVPAIADPALPATLAGPAPASAAKGPDGNPHGKALFAGACASCHDWTGNGALTANATLTGARAVNDPSAVNVVQMILAGNHDLVGRTQAYMPAFGPAYTDLEVADLANYVTARFGTAGGPIGPADVAKLRALR